MGRRQPRVATQAQTGAAQWGGSIAFSEGERTIKIRAASRTEYVRIIETLADRGAEAVILGCTEIGSLVQQEHTEIPLFDTTIIHARAAIDEALRE